MAPSGEHTDRRVARADDVRFFVESAVGIAAEKVDHARSVAYDQIFSPVTVEIHHLRIRRADTSSEGKTDDGSIGGKIGSD